MWLRQPNAEAVRKIVLQARLPFLAEQSAAGERWATEAILVGSK